MDTLLSIKVFRQVVESGSFTAAAVALDMSVAMVSKHVQNLEKRLGTRLLTRTSRRVALNDPGTLYYERSSEALNLLEEAEQALGLEERSPSGTLRLTAPTWFSSRFFARLLTKYRQQCPSVTLDVSLSDKFVDLVEEGLDLALRVSDTPAGLPLMPIEFVLAGNPEAPLITYAYSPNQTPSPWRTNDTTLMARLAAEGAAQAVLPKLVLEDIPGLEVIPTDAPLPHPTLYAVTHGRRRLAARVRSFLEFLQRQVEGDRIRK